jgi:hypothetical protein
VRLTQQQVGRFLGVVVLAMLAHRGKAPFHQKALKFAWPIAKKVEIHRNSIDIFYVIDYTIA